MTTANSITNAPQSRTPFVLPDPPEDPEDKIASFTQLTPTGSVHHLAKHLGDLETTLLAGERYLALAPTRGLAGIRYPDLLVAFGVDPAAYHRSNAYVISEQGKPPDFVLEIASISTGRIDVRDKPADYAALGIPEYWRFDETGDYHGARLAGDRLVDGQYQSIEIEELAGDVLQGYSAALDLHLRWEQGRLGWHDPATGRHILTYDDQRERADAAETAAAVAERRADAAEARVRELEERLRRQGG